MLFMDRDLSSESILARMIRLNGNITGTITYNEGYAIFL